MIVKFIFSLGKNPTKYEWTEAREGGLGWEVIGRQETSKVLGCGPGSTCTSEGGSGRPTERKLF